MKERNPLGFTLIELIIALAIVGILSAIAYPSYKNNIDQGKESEAKTALISLSVALNQLYLDNNSYLLNGAQPSAGDIFSSVVPVSGGTKTYDLNISAITATTYSITATPVDSTLASYTLDEAGNKTQTKKGSTLSYWE
ncbi:type IV pilin protein [Methylosoma difficile]